MQNKTNILIIDDNKDLSQNLNDVLTEIGYNTVVALDGNSAITLCGKKDFDLALVDMKLPDIDGLELVEKLSGILPELEYIIITAYGTLESAKKATGFKKIVAYELKPLDIDHLLVLIHQVIERKKAEEVLRVSEHQLQTLINAMPDFVCFKDGDGRWLKANDACIRIFQLDGIDYRGKKDSELAVLNSNLRGIFLTCEKTDTRAWRDGSMIQGEETVPDPDGSVRVYDVAKVPIFHPGGERKGLVILGHDITERKQAEEEIKESEEQYRSLTDALPQFIYRLDKDLKYVSANKAYCKACSISFKEIKGKTSGDIFPKELADKYMASDRKIIETERMQEYTEKSRSIGKENKWVNVIKLPVKDNKGYVNGMIGIYRDITERKQAEQELVKHREHLEELVQERTKELDEKNAELKRYNSLFEGRELRIKELRDRVKELEKKV